MNKLLANSFVLHLVWHSLILPGLATLAAGLVLLAFVRDAQNRILGGLWSLPLLIGLLTGYFAVYHNWSLWPHTVLAWLPALAIATVLLAGWVAQGPRHLGWLATAFLVIVASGAMFDPILRQATTFTTLLEWAGVAILWWLIWIGSASERDQRGAAASQVVLAAGLAIAGPFSQSLLLGQLAMVLGASWAVVIILSWLRPGMPLSEPVADLGALVLGFLYIELWYYDAAPWQVVLTLVVAAALGVAAHRLYHRLPRARQFPGMLIPAAVTALPTVVGIYFAWQAYSANSGGY